MGDYTLAKNAGLTHEIPKEHLKYLTVYYACEDWVQTGEGLISRLCTDGSETDGLLRLVPSDDKELKEFTRTKEYQGGIDLRVVNWGLKGARTSKYAPIVQSDTIQTFRNFVSAVVTHQVKKRMKRDGLLILIDEFDRIKNKEGIGSLIKALSSPEVKFGICGIGADIADIVEDHASLDRLLEQGIIHVTPMNEYESKEIIIRAEELFEGEITFDDEVKDRIVEISQGYPYFTQLIGKSCVKKANKKQTNKITREVFDQVLIDIKGGKSFPDLESRYTRAIGNSKDRQLLLHLLAEQPEDNASFHEYGGYVSLKSVRKDAEGLEIQYVDQLLPRLLDEKYGPILKRKQDSHGIYEFVNPIFRLYVQLRSLN